MEKEIQDLIDKANVLKDMQLRNLQLAYKNISEIKDENIQEFLKKSISLAKDGKLNINDFIEESKIHITNAS